MSYEKGSWYFDENREIPQNATVPLHSRWQLWYIKSFLSGAFGNIPEASRWKVYSSAVSSSVGNFGNGDYVDRWGTTFDSTLITKTVTTTALTHSWVVLQSPSINGSNYYLTIDYAASAASVDYAFAAYWSKTAPTGGTATASPSAPDMWRSMTNNLGATAATNYVNMNSNGTTSRRMHGKIADDGSFIILSSRNGTPDFAISFWALSGSGATDQYPVWTFAGGNTSNANVFSTNATRFDLSTNAAPSMSLSPLSGAFVANPIVNICAAASTTILDFQTLWRARLSNMVPFLPCMVFNSSTAFTTLSGSRGRIPDMGLAATYVTPAGMVDDETSPSWWSLGSIWIPGGSNPIL